MKIPDKLKSGDIFKTSATKAINGIIDYLKSIKPISGNNVRIDKRSNGFVIHADLSDKKRF